MKCRMQCTQNKIIRYMLTAPPKFHVGVNEFKYVGLLPVEYRVEKLNYLRTNIDMAQNQHLYSTRASDLDEVCFYIQTYANGIICHLQPNNVTLKRILKLSQVPFI